MERLTYKSLDCAKFQWELFSLANSRRNILFLQTDSQISEKHIAIFFAQCGFQIVGQSQDIHDRRIFMTDGFVQPCACMARQGQPGEYPFKESFPKWHISRRLNPDLYISSGEWYCTKTPVVLFSMI